MLSASKIAKKTSICRTKDKIFSLIELKSSRPPLENSVGSQDPIVTDCPHIPQASGALSHDHYPTVVDIDTLLHRFRVQTHPLQGIPTIVSDMLHQLLDICSRLTIDTQTGR